MIDKPRRNNKERKSVNVLKQRRVGTMMSVPGSPLSIIVKNVYLISKRECWVGKDPRVLSMAIKPKKE